MIIKCPSCAAQFDIDKSLKGEAVNCPDCGKAFVAGKKQTSLGRFALMFAIFAILCGFLWLPLTFLLSPVALIIAIVATCKGHYTAGTIAIILSLIGGVAWIIAAVVAVSVAASSALDEITATPTTTETRPAETRKSSKSKQQTSSNIINPAPEITEPKGAFGIMFGTALDPRNVLDTLEYTSGAVAYQVRPGAPYRQFGRYAVEITPSRKIHTITAIGTFSESVAEQELEIAKANIENALNIKMNKNAFMTRGGYTATIGGVEISAYIPLVFDVDNKYYVYITYTDKQLGKQGEKEYIDSQVY